MSSQDLRAILAAIVVIGVLLIEYPVLILVALLASRSSS